MHDVRHASPGKNDRNRTNQESGPTPHTCRVEAVGHKVRDVGGGRGRGRREAGGEVGAGRGGRSHKDAAEGQKRGGGAGADGRCHLCC